MISGKGRFEYKTSIAEITALNNLSYKSLARFFVLKPSMKKHLFFLLWYIGGQRPKTEETVRHQGHRVRPISALKAQADKYHHYSATKFDLP